MNDSKMFSDSRVVIWGEDHCMLVKKCFLKKRTLIFEATGYKLCFELWFVPELPTETFWDWPIL